MNSFSVASALPTPVPTPGYVADLDTPLFMFSESSVFTLRDCAEGILITGGIGAGKSSSSGAMIAKSYLKAGFGGVVCCVNVDEVDRWRRYAAETGRTHSLIVMDRSLEHRFNFMDYQMTVGRGSAFEAVEVLIEILAAAEGSGAAKASDPFWEQTLRQILRKTLPPLWAAYGRLTIDELVRFIQSRPPNEAALEPGGAFFETSFWSQTMQLAMNGGVHPLTQAEFRPILDYWATELVASDPKTTGNIIQTVTARLDPFLQGDLRQLFCTHSTFLPDLSFHGAVIVLDLSAHAWGKEGILAQHIFKIMWQRAMQLRPKTDQARPAFLFADEAQWLLAEADQSFASTARACKALIVYLTQNLPGIYAKLGPNAQNIADALLGNIATKIFHAQPDPRTAAWAAELIGKGVVWRRNFNESENASTGSSSSFTKGSGQGQSSQGGGTNISRGQGRGLGASETIDYRLQPSHFTTLRKGGGADRLSEAVVFQAGRCFDYTGSTWTPVLFRQE